MKTTFYTKTKTGVEPIKIIAFSDTHGRHDLLDIPPCDILIFAGDYTGMQHMMADVYFCDWFNIQPAVYKVVVPGNHDYNVSTPIWNGTHVLLNRAVTIMGVTILGSPYSVDFCNWNYMKDEKELEDMYSRFPADIDILVTHGPPKGICDVYKGEHIGSSALYDYTIKAQPKVHIFGHSHSHGNLTLNNTDFYNVSVLDHEYCLTNKVTTIGEV